VISVAERIVRHLREAGVGFLFGVPGGGSNLDLIDAAGRGGLPFVLTATETAGAIAALAQAEISGRPGACLTTLGPGVASVVNGVACAWLDRAPLLVFTDSRPSSGGGVFEHQRLDHRALLAPVTKWSATLSPENADEVLREAIDRATTYPRGPVHIDVPADVDAIASPQSSGGQSQFSVTAARPTTDDSRSTTGNVRLESDDWRLMTAARRPLLLVGLGACRPLDADAIRALCASRGVPAMVTYKAKGVVPDTDLHFAGLFTNGAIERSIVAEADLLIGVGLDPVELIPRPWTHKPPIVNVGPWAVDDRHVPFAAQLVTDIPSGMQWVGGLLPRAAWDLDVVHRAVVAQRQRVCPESARLTAHRVVQIAADAAATTARVTVDAGAHMFPATMLWPVFEPNGMLISNGLSTMGFALPAAIGAALLGREGAPGAIHDHDGPIVALTGDGGLLMCAAELLTAVRERLRIITIVFSDGSLSLIEVKQRQRAHAPSGVSLGDVAWATLAQSLGVAAHVAGTEAELESALVRALGHRGPSLIEARIDPSTYGDTLYRIRGS
jgi:acetolactate synthase I/II/III large subunit